jgi:hypothetical protein
MPFGKEGAALNASVFDELGRIIKQFPLHAGNNTVNASTLPAGRYIVIVRGNNDELYSEKIIK